jgi:hypothetical protein
MNRKIALFAAAIAALAFTCQGADAHGRRHINKKIAATAVVVGAASTAAYFAINNWKWNWNNSSGLTSLGAAGLTTMGCAAVSPMVATVVLHRQLTMREAHILVGSCVIPIVGGWLVNEVWNAHPEWEAGMPHPRHHRHHKKKMM